MQLTIREPGSAITHFIGCLMALIAASPLLMKAHGNSTHLLAMTIFACSMILLYGASTMYHSICHVSAKVLCRFRKLDRFQRKNRLYIYQSIPVRTVYDRSLTTLHLQLSYPNIHLIILMTTL